MLAPFGVWNDGIGVPRPPKSGLAPSPVNEAAGAMATADPNEERRRQMIAALLGGGGGFQPGQTFGPMQGAQLAATLMQAIAAGGGGMFSSTTGPVGGGMKAPMP